MRKLGIAVAIEAVISAAADKSARIPRHFLPQTKGAHCRFAFVAFGIVFACQQDLAQGLFINGKERLRRFF
jgi:hypothetical protein